MEMKDCASPADFWESCWQSENSEELYGYLKKYQHMDSPDIDLFKAHGLRKICDAACGFGAYTLAFLSRGFEVESFDISPRAVEITRAGLRRFGYADVPCKAADILSTGYPNEAFDGVVAHSVLDHLTVASAQKALAELARITRPGGLILLSFDTAEEDDFRHAHILLPDGSLQYTGSGKRSGMIFHPYDRAGIRKLLDGYNIIYESVNQKDEQIAILQKGE